MRYRWDKKYLYWGMTAFFVIAASLLVLAILFRIDIVLKFFGWLLGVCMPLIYGVVIAFLLDPVVRFCERMYYRIFKKRVAKLSENPKKKQSLEKRLKAIAILIALAFGIGIISGLLFLVIPQILVSLSRMVDNFSIYYRNFTNWVNTTLQDDSAFGNLLKGVVGEGFSRVTHVLESTVMPRVQDFVTGLATGLFSVFGVVLDLILGVIMAIFFMYHKKKFIAHIKMFLYSFVRLRWANALIRLGQDVNKYFGGFITGKILDSAIIGVICFGVMSLFRFDYALLISVIVGVTNIIPFFGPFIGAIPSGFFLLMVDPMQCFWFIIWVLILQQIDGNVIGPMVLGNRTGVSGFWVITSITVFGGLMGIVGIIIAVPLCAVILVITRRRIRRGLLRRKMEYDTAVYLHSGTIYEDDDGPGIDDDSYQKPLKTIEMQRPPEAHEVQREEGTLTKLVKKGIVFVKKKRSQTKNKK